MNPDISKVIAIEVKIRAILSEAGFKNKKDYYDWRKKVYADIPQDFKDEQGGFEIEWTQNEHIARKLQPGEAATILVPSLKFTKHKEEKR